VATHDAIRALGDAVRAILQERCPLAELDLAVDTAFTLASTDSLVGAPASAEGFALCLWRVSVDTSLHNPPPRRAADGTLARPALPLDLHYLLLPQSADAARQARMLGWALRLMHDMPVLSGTAINRHARSSAFGEHESVEFIADPLSQADQLTLWQRLGAGYQPGMAYTARRVLIDSAVAGADTLPLGRTRTP
jgi:hypothetical protein